MKKSIFVAAALSAVFLSAPAHAQFAKAEKAIEYRQGAYTVMAQHFGSLGAMVKGSVPFDAAKAANDGDVLAIISKLPAAAFVKGSESGHGTNARPEIWSETAKFKELDTNMTDAVGKLSVAAKSGDLAQIKATFGAAAQTCKACHDQFKKK